MTPERFLNEAEPFVGEKLEALEQMVAAIMQGDPKLFVQANNLLDNLNENTNFWLQTDQVVSQAKSPNTIFYALNSLHSGIKTKWSLLDAASREKLRLFVLGLITSWADGAASAAQLKQCLTKANSILVDIVKKELLTTWKTALTDIIKSSASSQAICENNLLILRELGIEVLQFGKTNITSDERKALTGIIETEIKGIYDVCDFVGKLYVSNREKVSASLPRAMLETLEAYLQWMGPEYVLLSDLIDGILTPLLAEKRFAVPTLKCLAEAFSPTHLNFRALQVDDKEKAAVRLF